MFCSSDITTLKSIYFAYFCYNKICNNYLTYCIQRWKDVDFTQANCFNCGQCRTCGLCRQLVGKSEVLPVSCQCMFSLMKLIVNNQEIFQTHSLYMVLVQRMSIIFIDQMPSFHVFRKNAYFASIAIFRDITNIAISLRNDKA
jgi:hypothetical protein